MMRDFFLNIDSFHIYKWSDYFTPPPNEDELSTLVQAKAYNTRITHQYHVNQVTLPVSGGIGYFFILKGNLNITTRGYNPEKNTHLCEGEFCKIPYGAYIFEYSDECKYINMSLYEEFPEAIKKKLEEHYGKKI